MLFAKRIGGESPVDMTKFRIALSEFGEFWAHIAYFWLGWMGHNHFANTKSQHLARKFRTLDMTYANATWMQI